METRTQSATIFKTPLISIVADDYGERISLHDSDDEYIEYLFYKEDCEDYNKKVLDSINLLADMNEPQLADYCNQLFAVRKVIPKCDDGRFKSLRERYGNEYVNRIGCTAIIIKE